MERRADPSVQLDVDQSILDYLLYNAIRAFICDFRAGNRDDRAHDRHESSFLILFRSMHPDEHGTKEIQIRLRLLKFASLFCSRFTSVPIEPSERKLKSLRDQGRRVRKASHTAGSRTGTIKYESTDPAAKATNKTNLDINTTASLDGPARPTSLIDSLPSFMALSAAQSALQELPVSDVWMRLAAGLMAHAALEQCLVYRMDLTDALDEAFAWRFDPGSTAEEGTDEWAINAMFFGEEGEVVGWSDIRNEHIRAVIPPDGISLETHAMELLANELPIDTLEESLMSFIEGLLNAQPKPLYGQLESRKVDGLSKKEVQDMREAIGID
ncbi:MAG: hypothetical protein Q9195_008669 [Heterodermia aff. obscurata]